MTSFFSQTPFPSGVQLWRPGGDGRPRIQLRWHYGPACTGVWGPRGLFIYHRAHDGLWWIQFLSAGYISTCSSTCLQRFWHLPSLHKYLWYLANHRHKHVRWFWRCCRACSDNSNGAGSVCVRRGPCHRPRGYCHPVIIWARVWWCAYHCRSDGAFGLCLWGRRRRSTRSTRCRRCSGSDRIFLRRNRPRGGIHSRTSDHIGIRLWRGTSSIGGAGDRFWWVFYLRRCRPCGGTCVRRLWGGSGGPGSHHFQ